MSQVFSVENWVDMFREVGLDSDTMHRWHHLFEIRHPEAHQSFLQWLDMPDDEIVRVRRMSQEQWKAV